jgi:hypothetical protein
VSTFVATCFVFAASAASSDADAAERVSRLELFPRDRLYQRHLADPSDPGMGVEWLVLDEVDVPESGDARFQLALGGIFGLVRLRPPGWQDGGVEVGILAGFVGQFDADHGYDNLGWDGFYGLMLSTSRGGPWAFRGGIKHTSSHVGDEYAERTGRRRIDYTREELAVAVSRRLDRCCRAYVEGAWGYELRNQDLQAPGRAQVGFEVEPPPKLWDGRVGWYIAVDAGAYEESDWQVDWSSRFGLALPSPDRTWRLAFTWRRGRVPLGEHSQHRESYFGAGLLLDL